MSNLVCRTCATVALATLGCGVDAAVADRSAAGFTVHHSFAIAAPPSRVYAVFTDIGQWWDPSHSYSHDGDRLTLDTTNGGCFCETLPDGGHVRHLEVVFVQPGKELRLIGGLGPLQPIGASGTMVVTLEATGDGTTLDLRYAVGGYLAGGLDSWAEPVDGVLLQQLQRLERLIETGTAAAAP
jgi:uncharacterized protein YndB with AHSA1/START domain